jgi:DNA-nicking Smr family endonuclease
MARKKDVGGFHTPFARLAALTPPQPAAVKGTTALARITRPQPVVRLAEGEGKDNMQSDEAMFLREVLGTTPLSALKPKAGTRVAATVPQAVGQRPAPGGDDAEVLATLADLCEGEGEFEITDGDATIEGTAPGIDRRLLKQLRAGDHPVEGSLDLHGLSREAARASVARFVSDSRRAGRRCVLIIHGRGQHSERLPVLKAAVKSWLERGPVARGVLAFATARPADGGAGAVYVLLRK